MNTVNPTIAARPLSDDADQPLRIVARGGDAPQNEASTPAEAPEAVPARKKTRKRAFAIFGGVLVLAGLGYGASVLLAPPSEETDDAYVGGDVVSITSREGGTVIALHADNTQQVQRGAALVDLDPATQDVALAAAEADLGKVVRAFRADRSSVDEASAEIAKAQSDLTKAQADLVRRKAAAAEGAVSGEEVSHAADALSAMQASVTLAQAKRAQAASSVAGTDVYNNPAVLAAMAAVRRAAISRAYMSLSAPVAGVVTNRTVQLGQRVAPGTPLMAVVPLNALWVDANFRETQLKDLRVGQPVTIKADMYGSGHVFHGKVLGLGAGSGSAFSLLPAQNASGNWIKIVQRVPVRIALDPNELAKTPLRIGLSVTATVDTRNRSGAFVSTAQAPAGGTQAVVDSGPREEARIRQIVAFNLGSGR